LAATVSVVGLGPSGRTRFCYIAEDITERKQAEKTLQESEQRFRELADAMPQIVYTTGPDGVSTYVNKQWQHYTGIPQEQARSFDWSTLLHPDDVQSTAAGWLQSLQASEPLTIEYRLKHEDGKYRWHLTRALPVRNEDGKVIRWIGTSTDIHERKLTELKLRESEGRQQLLAELGEAMRRIEEPDELLFTILQTVGEHLQVRRCLFIEINTTHDEATVRQEYCRGVPAVATKYRVSDYSPETRADMEAGRTVVNSDAQVDPRTAAIYDTTYRPYGERAYIAVPLLREGHWVAVLWVSTDSPREWSAEEIMLLETVGERAWLALENAQLNAATKAALEQARESERQFRELANSMPQLVWTANSQGVLDYYNTRVSEYSGATRAADGSWTWEPLLHPDDLGPTLAAWQAALEAGRTYWFEHRISMADGSYRWHLSRAIPIRDETGAVVKWFGTATDIHDLREAQAQAATAQHELTLLAEVKERNELTQELHDNVAQSLASLNFKIKLVNDLLARGQLEESQATLQELHQVVSETYTDIRDEIFNLPALPVKELNFRELLDSYIDKYKRFYRMVIQLVIEAEEALFDFSGEVAASLIRALQEALINVRKHAGVDTAIIRLGQQDDQAYISVEDQGAGFDSSQVKTDKPSGFGLHFMRERMEGLGGRLEVNSSPGHGTQVRLFCP
jgi:PAS domain S-box-containing protein